MIGRLSGTLLEKNPPQILLDVQGVAYEVDVPGRVTITGGPSAAASAAAARSWARASCAA